LLTLGISGNRICAAFRTIARFAAKVFQTVENDHEKVSSRPDWRCFLRRTVVVLLRLV